MPSFLILFNFGDDERGLHISARDYDEAEAIVEAIRNSAWVEGEIQETIECVSRGRLN